jgi:hypothetical protein
MSMAAIQEFGAEVWEWRLATSFRTSDDIPRVDRTPGWTPDFSPAAVDARRERLVGLRDRWWALRPGDDDVAAAVDHRLLGSALARVTWELDLLRNWERDAVLQVMQIIGPFFDQLLRPPPFRPELQEGLVTILAAAPAQVEVARANLARAGVAPLARAAVRLLGGIRTALPAAVDGLEGHVEAAVLDRLRGAGREAAEALAGLAGWLDGAAAGMPDIRPVGRDGFRWFLHHVALLPREPEHLVLAARREYERAVVWETIERNRWRDVPLPAIPADAATQVANEARLEQQVRDFYEREGLLSQPDSLRHYLTAPLPPYLAPLTWLGVTDDLTFDDRLHEDGVSYTPDPRPDLPYFYAANARDPRLGIIHEGAHYQQLALAWAHPDPIRRRYYDSVPNEGIAFYNEEFLLQAGLLDDAPRSREVVHNFNRLRALRVEVDVNLATGVFTLEEGTRAFVDLVPMDEDTAFGETVSYTANPGHAMTYLVGKQEILAMQADAIRTRGAGFSLRAFHDRLWREGNVPFALQRWELLGDRGDVDALDAAGRWW